MFGYTIDARAAGRRGSTRIAGLFLIGLCSTLHAQSSPLTIQPSTSRVGVNTTNPTTALDVTGTVKATTFQGDGSLLTNLPGGGGGTGNGGYGSRGQFSRNNPAAPDSQYDLKADLVILAKPSDQSTVTRYNPGTITNNIGLSGPAANGRDQSIGFPVSSWVHFYWIWNGTTLATLSSASPPPTGPTLPTGYTHWSYAGAAYLSSGSVLVKTFIQGSRAYIQRTNVYDGTPVAGAENTVNIVNQVPANATAVELGWNAVFGALANSGLTFRFLTGIDHIEFRTVDAAAVRANGAVVIPNVNQSIIFVKDHAAKVVLDVAGYSLPNGGE